jgi:hypothetical protein
VCIYTYACMYVCMYVYVRTYMYIHVCVYGYTQMCRYLTVVYVNILGISLPISLTSCQYKTVLKPRTLAAGQLSLQMTRNARHVIFFHHTIQNDTISRYYRGNITGGGCQRQKWKGLLIPAPSGLSVKTAFKRFGGKFFL